MKYELSQVIKIISFPDEMTAHMARRVLSDERIDISEYYGSIREVRNENGITKYRLSELGGDPLKGLFEEDMLEVVTRWR